MESELIKYWLPILVTIIISVPSSFLAWPQYKIARKQLAARSDLPKLQKTTFEWRIPLWVQRAGSFIVQTGAIYIIVQEYISNEPLTRATVVLVASMTGVVSICFVLPWIQGVYEVIEDRTDKR